MARVRDAPHARIYSAWMELPAWRTLSPYARSLLVELFARYRPLEPNRFELSDRTAAFLANCGRQTAARALIELEKRGWIEVARVGKLTGPKAKRASWYSLTYFERLPGEPGSRAFLTWRPDGSERPKSGPATADFRAVNGSLQSLPRSLEDRPAWSTSH
jgi:hypothetical protein